MKTSDHLINIYNLKVHLKGIDTGLRGGAKGTPPRDDGAWTGRESDGEGE